ncbi:MAG: CRTAC1 family protein [Planctomycetes bacterium]|nr:CRTAC1 family protein [Planctomycetota bacterium]
MDGIEVPSEPQGGPSRWPLTECAESCGLRFRHFNGMSGELYFCETVGPGVALFDYDSDGDLDVYAVQGRMLGPKARELATFPPSEVGPCRDRLYRNELVPTGRLSFTDVTVEAGIVSEGYGMGAAVGDFDGDGHPDLFVTNFGPDLLLRNRGDGTFEDVTARAGVGDDRWTTSAAFVDIDRDGDLDLFVCAYVRFTLANHKPCYAPTTARDYCGPLSYDPLPDRLYRNDGDGRFSDISAESGISSASGSALGVVCADFDGDGREDLFVANDGMRNFLWLGDASGRFRDEALLAGCAFNQDGVAEASMGVDAEDFDGDGDIDLFMTHLDSETNTLYVNDGTATFEDRSAALGIGNPSRSFTGFGTAWFDLDNDGWLDLFCANGAVKTIPALAAKGDPYPLSQSNQLFHNEWGRSFADWSVRAGPALGVAEVSRGAAFGDLDNDGDVDIVVANNSGPLRLLRNDLGQEASWIGLMALRSEDRYDLGARIEVRTERGAPIWRSVRRAASYCSSNDPRRVIGLTDRGAVLAVRVHWTDGSCEEWTEPRPERYHRLIRGAGRRVD